MPRQITIDIASANPADPNIPLEDFLKRLQAVLDSLKKTEEVIAGTEPSGDWEIVAISKESPTHIVLEYFPAPGEPQEQDVGESVGPRFLGYLHELATRGEAPTELDRDTIETFGRVAGPVAPDRVTVTIRNGGPPVEATPALRANVEKILKPKLRSLGTVKGRLEYLNIHGARNVLWIFPAVGPDKVTCYFPENLLEKAKTGVGQTVRVHGVVTYRARDPHPSSVRVQEIEILPPDDQLPSLMDLRGAAPDLTGDQSSEDFIREIRRAW
jgi:hypothetical protein